MTNPSYNCSQAALYQVGRNVYQSLTDNLAAFTAFKGKYLAAYVTAGLAEITAAEALLDFQARSAQAEVNYINLVNQLGVCTDLWQNLKRYIVDAYVVAEQKPRLEEAGSLNYDKATRKDWDAAKALLLAAKNFITAHTAAL